jgi:hypothetical protein
VHGAVSEECEQVSKLTDEPLADDVIDQMCTADYTAWNALRDEHEDRRMREPSTMRDLSEWDRKRMAVRMRAAAQVLMDRVLGPVVPDEWNSHLHTIKEPFGPNNIPSAIATRVLYSRRALVEAHEPTLAEKIAGVLDGYFTGPGNWSKDAAAEIAALVESRKP